MKDIKAKKIPSYIYISICRAYLPLSTICLIFYLTKTESALTVSTVSFIFAIAQIASQLDGGTPSYVMSDIRYGDWYMLRSGINFYRKTGFRWVTFLAIFSLAINEIYDYNYGLIISSSYTIAVSISLYNISVSVFIKEQTWLLLSIYILLSGLLQISLVLWYFLGDTGYSPEYTAIYGIAPLVAALIFYISKKKSDIHIESKHASKLQISQLASSLVTNKEYILLYIFSLHHEAAIYSLVGRLIFMPMQITSIYISKIWSNLDEELRKSKQHLINCASIAVKISALLTLPVLIYTHTQNAELILLIFLAILNIINAFSGVASAFSSTNPQSIPKISWFFSSIVILFVTSWLVYKTWDWRISIGLTAVYFAILTRKLIKNIDWK